MPFQTLRRCDLTIESPAFRDYAVFPIFDSAMSEDKRRDATGCVVGGMSVTMDMPIVFAEEIHEAPARRNLRIMEIMRRVRAATGYRKLWVEGDEDMLHSLQSTFKENGEADPVKGFIIEKLSPGGRNKHARIEEQDNYMERLSVGPEAELYAKRMLEWSRTSGTPDHLPDAGAYFCETAKPGLDKSAKWDKWRTPPKDSMALRVWKAQRQKHSTEQPVPTGW